MTLTAAQVVGLALVVDTVGSDEVGQAMGYVGLSTSVATLLAPLLGGIVYARLGYYAVFAMVFSLISLDVVLPLSLVEKRIAVKWLAHNPERPDSRITTDPDSQSSSPQEDVHGSTYQAEHRHREQSEARPTSRPRGMEKPKAEETLARDKPTHPRPWISRLPLVVSLLASRRLLSALRACMIQASLNTGFKSILPLFVRDTFH